MHPYKVMYADEGWGVTNRGAFLPRAGDTLLFNGKVYIVDGTEHPIVDNSGNPRNPLMTDMPEVNVHRKPE